uniref:energy transducer TonB n=1 Tax=Ningiella ruwaisensis TaxID=2364274 RepID=UPI0010A08B09|nr:energy transducer TonB [Ningiella ruwaisensis]
MKRLFVFLFVLVLVACSSTPTTPNTPTTPKKQLLGQPISIGNADLNQYWVQQNQTFSFKTPSNISPYNIQPGFVVVEYLIDSNGHTFDAQVVESQPEGMWDEAGLEAVTNLRYKPSKSNNSRTPVIVQSTFYFN